MTFTPHSSFGKARLQGSRLGCQLGALARFWHLKLGDGAAFVRIRDLGEPTGLHDQRLTFSRAAEKGKKSPLTPLSRLIHSGKNRSTHLLMCGFQWRNRSRRGRNLDVRKSFPVLRRWHNPETFPVILLHTCTLYTLPGSSSVGVKGVFLISALRRMDTPLYSSRECWRNG
jgi:hypothetical protein